MEPNTLHNYKDDKILYITMPRLCRDQLAPEPSGIVAKCQGNVKRQKKFAYLFDSRIGT